MFIVVCFWLFAYCSLLLIVCCLFFLLSVAHWSLVMSCVPLYCRPSTIDFNVVGCACCLVVALLFWLFRLYVIQVLSYFEEIAAVPCYWAHATSAVASVKTALDWPWTDKKSLVCKRLLHTTMIRTITQWQLTTMTMTIKTMKTILLFADFVWLLLVISWLFFVS